MSHENHAASDFLPLLLIVPGHFLCLGELHSHDLAANREALNEGIRLFSRYRSESGQPCWIITEADPSSTTILLPGAY